MTEEDINLIKKMNFLLSDPKGLEDKLGNSKTMQFPIFIIGAPRSGTTLVYQALISALDVCYPSNLIARFWENPLLGYALQNDIYPEFSKFISSFESMHGYSENSALEPHEFGYFWSRWFDHSKTHFTSPDTEINPLLKKEINALLNFSQKDWIFKNLTLGLKIPLLKKKFPKAKFVVVTRTPGSVAASLLMGRIKRFGNKNHWWSLIPKEIDRLNQCSAEEQVVAQVFYCYRQIFDDLQILNEQDYHIVDYRQFCGKTKAIVTEIAEKWDLNVVNEIPLKFKCDLTTPPLKIAAYVDQYFTDTVSKERSQWSIDKY